MDIAEIRRCRKAMKQDTALLAADCGDDRTLLVGETADGLQFHVYLHDGRIHRWVDGYGRNGVGYIFEHMSSAVWLNGCELVPDGTVFPESTDFEFAKLLVERSISIPFGSVRPPRHTARLARYGPYAGTTHLRGASRGLGV